jgi:proteasome assembly chaperone (PAC2) family protein
MGPDCLKIHAKPKLHGTRMLLGLSGWMDGGDVSTGTVDCIATKLRARTLAGIEPEEFYVYSFPGSMEVSSLFRPHTKIKDGLVRVYQPPENVFRYDEQHNLILFKGKEPNFNWTRYAEAVLAVAAQFSVERMYFVGSVAGVVPHTREPRLHSSVSDEAIKDELQQYGIRFSNYEGPASLITYLTRLARDRGIGMATFVAEIPAYVQGTNPICIEAVVRRIAGILGIQIELDDLQRSRRVFEKRLNKIVPERPELAALIKKLESDYDSEVFDTMGELKEWLERQGIRLD